jgi:hypothetical protein
MSASASSMFFNYIFNWLMFGIVVFLFGYGISLQSRLNYEKDARLKLRLKHILNNARIQDLEV